MKRVLCIILSCVLVIGMVAVPVFAEENMPQYPNILDNYDYFEWGSDSDDYGSSDRYTSFNNPDYYDGDGDGYFSLWFGGNNSSYFEDIIITFKSNAVFDRGKLYISSIDGSIDYSDFGERVASDLTSDGMWLQTYRFTCQSYFLEDFLFSFWGSWEANYYIEVLSVFNTASDSTFHADYAYYQVTGTLLNRQDGQYYNQIFVDDESAIPVDIYLSDFAENPVDDQVNVFFMLDGSDYPSSTDFYLDFVSTGVWDNYYDHDELTSGGLMLQHEDDSEFSINVPIDVSYSIFNDSKYGLPLYHVTIHADLSEFYLPDYDIIFSTIVNARFPNYSSGSQYPVYYIRFTQAFFVVRASDNSLQSFFRDVERYFNNIWSVVSGSADRVISNLYNLFDSLNDHIDLKFSDFKSYLHSMFGSLDETLRELLGDSDPPSLPDQSDQQQEIQDSIDDMEGVGDDFAEAGDEMEELLPSTPNYEDTGLPGLTDIASARIVELRAVFVVLWDNDFIIQLLTFSCLLALGGFILFGER